VAGAAGAGGAAGTTRRRAFDAAGAAADAETGNELLDVARTTRIADDVFFLTGADEALEPPAALLALVFIEGHDGVIVEEPVGLVYSHRPSQANDSGGCIIRVLSPPNGKRRATRGLSSAICGKNAAGAYWPP
jgi:hypothetical protein